MTQTLALLMDTYRELNAKKLFWITLILSAVVASTLLMIGIDKDGLKVLVWELDESVIGLSTDVVDKASFYKWMFSDLGIRWWLGFAAALLAIISTASFFPDIMKDGAIDLLLTKPISRLRLFITRYVLGLGFAFLQVLVFTTICFFAIGLRGGVWEPGLFLAVPFFVLFFSYLFAVSVLIGVLTRSTIASLLLTSIFFLLLFALNTVDFWGVRAGFLLVETRAEILEEHYEFAEQLEDKQKIQFELDYGMTVEQLGVEARSARQSADSYAGFANTIVAIKTPLPKTGETLSLLTTVLIDAADLPEQEVDEELQVQELRNERVRSGGEIMQETAEELERPVWWVIGTSLLFEGVVLAVAGWFFCKRDY